MIAGPPSALLGRVRLLLGDCLAFLGSTLRRWLPETPAAFWQALCDPQRSVAARFLLDRGLRIRARDRYRIVRQHYIASARLISPHTTEEILTFVCAILTLPKERLGCIVEAGCFKGSSSAKFSVAAKLAGRRLVICDSFQGLPYFDEQHGMSIENREVVFHEGDFAGSLDEVKANLQRYGELEVCDFVPGWFDQSLPNWNKPIAAIYLDVDLAASTRSCLKHLYPWLGPGCPLYSQDGHLPLVLKVFQDRTFWEREFNTEPPPVDGIWKRKLIKLTKPSPGQPSSHRSNPTL